MWRFIEMSEASMSIPTRLHSPPHRKQRGDLLIESLIGLVLMAIIGMGVVFVTSKMSISHKDMRLQEIVVNQLRAQLMNNGNGVIDLCTNKPQLNVPGIDLQPADIEVQGCGVTTTATVTTASGVVEIANVPRPLVVRVSHQDLGGEIIVGGAWN
jgi:type II secretory pathway pseudopilin PulG